jgi:hypothetical protein
VSAKISLSIEMKLGLAFEKLFKRKTPAEMEQWQIAENIFRHKYFSTLGNDYCAWIIYFIANAIYPPGVDSMRIIRPALDSAPPYFGKPKGTDSGSSTVEFWYRRNIEKIEKEIENKVTEILMEPV